MKKINWAIFCVFVMGMGLGFSSCDSKNEPSKDEVVSAVRDYWKTQSNVDTVKDFKILNTDKKMLKHNGYDWEATIYHGQTEFTVTRHCYPKKDQPSEIKFTPECISDEQYAASEKGQPYKVNGWAVPNVDFKKFDKEHPLTTYTLSKQVVTCFYGKNNDVGSWFCEQPKDF
jgi:hypothetical protein